jgi:arginase
VQDKGNVEVPIVEMCAITDPKLKYIDCIVPMSRRIAGAVATSIQGGNLPVVLGGDHSLSIGSIRGAAKHKKIGVLWVDAHADFNTNETTPSGNIHGMPLAALCGLGAPELVQLWDEAVPVIASQNVAIIGARDIDAGEKRNLHQAGIMVMSMEQVDRLGLVTCMETALEQISKNTDGIYLSFDMDVMDPRHAPGVGTAVAGGLTYREAHLISELVAETNKLVGMDVVEVNSILDIQNQTALLAVEFILSALGKRTWIEG